MLIHGSAGYERRILTIVGIAAVLCVAAAALLLIVVNPFGGRAPGLVSVTIDSPYVGQGVSKGTALVLHGVTVGEVTAVSSLPSGGVRLDTELQRRRIAGLTDTLEIDFRPVNYFGVAGINLSAGTGGHELRDGMLIKKSPKGNFTLQTLLFRLGEVSTGVLTPQLIRVMDRATRYTDALDPLIETVMIAANAVAQTQTVTTARLLTNTAGLSIAFPSAVDALSSAGSDAIHNDEHYLHKSSSELTDDQWQHIYKPTLEVAGSGVLSYVGKLEASHVPDLFSLVDAVKAVASVVPPLIRPEGFAERLAELRSRFEKMYGGTPQRRALQVRIVLDRLPGVAAPLNAMGAP